MKRPAGQFPTRTVVTVTSSVVLGIAAGWVFFGAKSPDVVPQHVSIFPLPAQAPVAVSRSEAPPVRQTAPAVAAQVGEAQILNQALTAPGDALEAAGRLQNASARAALVQNIMAGWLQKDRLDATEWLAHHRDIPEFDPLSAQVSNAFFPDDTEMSSIWAFNIQSEELRQPLVDRLVKYWKSGAHLAYPEESTPSPSEAAPTS